MDCITSYKGVHMSLTLTQFDRIPSIGAILGTQGHKEVLDEINRSLGSASFFGSTDDPFADQHQYFVEKVIAPIQLVAQQFKQSFAELKEPNKNVFRSIVSIKDLEHGIPECMWVPIAMHPIIRELGEQSRVDMFGINPKNLPEENVYQRLIDNGRASFDLEELKANGGKYTVEFEYRSDDPQLTDDDLEYIEDTYNFIELFYNDLDSMYEKLNKSHLLKHKSYMQEDMQIRDLDFTAFPNKKG